MDIYLDENRQIVMLIFHIVPVTTGEGCEKFGRCWINLLRVLGTKTNRVCTQELLFAINVALNRRS